MATCSFTENLVGWQALVTNLQPLVANPPHIARSRPSERMLGFHHV